MGRIIGSREEWGVPVVQGPRGTVQKSKVLARTAEPRDQCRLIRLLPESWGLVRQCPRRAPEGGQKPQPARLVPRKSTLGKESCNNPSECWPLSRQGPDDPDREWAALGVNPWAPRGIPPFPAY